MIGTGVLMDKIGAGSGIKLPRGRNDLHNIMGGHGGMMIPQISQARVHRFERKVPKGDAHSS